MSPPLALSGVAGRSNRTLLALRYSGTRSIAIHRRRRPSATTPVVFEPAKGSIIVSPSSVSSLIKNSGRAAGKRAGCILSPSSLLRFAYSSFAALLPNFSIVSGIGSSRSLGNSFSTTFGGIAPPASTLSKESLITWPDGRTVGLTPLRLNRIISGLYSFRTRVLLALGQGVFDKHKAYSE